MFRQLLAALLALTMLLFCVPAMAEEGEYAVYTQVDYEPLPLTQLYSMEYPAGYIVVDINTVESLKEIPAEELPEIINPNFGDDSLPDASFEQLYPLVEWRGMNTYLVNPEDGSYISITFGIYESGVVLHRPFINTIRLNYQVRSNHEAFFYDSGTFCNYGGQEFGRLAMTIPTLNGGPADGQVYMLASGNYLYILEFYSYDEVPEEMVEHVLNSFTVQKK